MRHIDVPRAFFAAAGLVFLAWAACTPRQGATVPADSGWVVASLPDGGR